MITNKIQFTLFYFYNKIKRPRWLKCSAAFCKCEVPFFFRRLLLSNSLLLILLLKLSFR